MENKQKKSCYQLCNERYTAMQPQRLFCKKGCDSDQSFEGCKSQTCNKICLKGDTGQNKLWFNFLYRAPKNPGPCLQSCTFGCNVRNDD